jgi:MFS family permease
MLGTAPQSTQAERPTGEAGRLPPGAKAILAAALLAVFVAALDLTVITTILARIIFDLGVNVAEIERYSWIVSGYLLAYLITIPIAGRVSDLVGRRPVFLAALTLFALGSIWCTVAQGAGAVDRRADGAGARRRRAGAGDPRPRRRSPASAPARHAVGAIGAIDTLGWVLGPLWGAGVVGVLGTARLGLVDDWRWVFASTSRSRSASWRRFLRPGGARRARRRAPRVGSTGPARSPSPWRWR